MIAGGNKNNRVPFGAFCTWWGTIDEVSKALPIPTCPHCSGVLYEEPDMDSFLKRLDSVPADQYPNYRAVMEWQRNNKIPCSKSYGELLSKYEARKQ